MRSNCHPFIWLFILKVRVGQLEQWMVISALGYQDNLHLTIFGDQVILLNLKNKFQLILSTSLPHILLHVTFLWQWLFFPWNISVYGRERISYFAINSLSLECLFPFFSSIFFFFLSFLFFFWGPNQASSFSSKSEPSNYKTLTLKKHKCKRWQRWKPREKESVSPGAVHHNPLSPCGSGCLHWAAWLWDSSFFFFF